MQSEGETCSTCEADTVDYGMSGVDVSAETQRRGENAGTRARRTDGRTGGQTDRETGQGSSKRLMLMEGRSEWGLSADVVDDQSD